MAEGNSGGKVEGFEKAKLRQAPRGTDCGTRRA